jgi:hypothetical protein
MAQRRCLNRQLVRMRATAQETEIGSDLKLGVRSWHQHLPAEK